MSRGDQGQRGEQVAGHYLEELLRRPGDYRKRWMTVAKSKDLLVRPDRVSQTAVCEVLMECLKTEGEEVALGNNDSSSKRPLKSTVSRALSGKSLSNKTLNLFIRAFEINDADADFLHKLRVGETNETPVVRGDF